MNKKVNFINLTPHKIVLKGKSEDQTIEPSGVVARVKSHETPLGVSANGIPIYERTFSDVENLPNPDAFPSGAEKTTIYLVSSMILTAVPQRADVAAPDTGASAFRDVKGHITSVTQLIMNKGV